MEQRLEEIIKKVSGRYVGFTPTDESESGFGEIEMIVDEKGMRCRVATGLRIQEESIRSSELTLDEDTIAKIQAEYESEYKSKSDQEVYIIKHKHMTHLFIQDVQKRGLVLQISGGMGDFLGPTLLFDQKLVDAGLYNEALEAIFVERARDYPTLASGGKRITYE